MSPKILLIGSGGVGTMAAYALEFEHKSEVTSVIRSDYEKIVNKGFTIDSCDYGKISNFRSTHIVKSVDEAKKNCPYDFIVVSTKNVPEVLKITDLIKPVVTQGHSIIVLIQNGIDIEVPILEIYPDNIVLSGTSMISSTNYNGIIYHEGADMLQVGYFMNNSLPEKDQEDAARRFIDLYDNKFIDCSYDPCVRYTRWRKLIYNAALNSICALTGTDVARLEIFGTTATIVNLVMDEIITIAKSEGIVLDESIKEFMIRSDGHNWYEPSMLVDIKKGNYIEVEILVGNPLKIAKKNGVNAPYLSAVYELLKVKQYLTMETKKLLSLPEVRPIPTLETPINVLDYLK